MISFKYRSAILIGAQLVYILTSGLWQDPVNTLVLPVLLYVGLFAAGGFLIANSKRWLLLYILVTLSGIALGLNNEIIALRAGSIVLLSLSHVLLFRQLFIHIMKPTTLLGDRLLSGVAGYLLLSIFWALQMQWSLLETNEAIQNHVTGEFIVAGPELLYYSIVTLTTLGFGDISPMTWLAKAISAFTSFSGVLYLAIFISAIVGSADFGVKSGGVDR